MQVNNDTDEDLDIEIESGRPGADPQKKRKVVDKGCFLKAPPGFGPINAARIFETDTDRICWEQKFDGAHDLVVRNPFVELTQ